MTKKNPNLYFAFKYEPRSSTNRDACDAISDSGDVDRASQFELGLMTQEQEELFNQFAWKGMCYIRKYIF